jgi:hypothetical protein
MDAPTPIASAPSDLDRRLLLGAAGLAGIAVLASARAHAGPLDPPAGAVASTAKPLAELEPRTAINATNTPGDFNSLFQITQSGSYYLAGNITGVSGKHGIKILASGVTIDLNGFDLTGVPGSFDGVTLNTTNLTNITVVNGSIRNWGNDGIDFGSFSVLSARIEGVLASGNTGFGIKIGAGTIISRCVATSNGSSGFFTGNGCAVIACIASGNTGTGIAVGGNCTVVDCTSQLNLVHGIATSNACSIRGNTCDSNGVASGTGAGISFGGVGSRIEGNTCANNGRGFTTNGAPNLIIGNLATANATNYSLVGTGAGPLITESNVATNTSPHANFDF